jgi:MOSC domain-containing protein YiiM
MLAHGRLTRDPDAVRVLVDHNRQPLRGFGTPACAGIYAEVLRPGQVRVGDPVRIGVTPTLSEEDIILPEVRDG